MKKSLMLLAGLSMAATLASAGPKQNGTIFSQTSVTCGEKKLKKEDINLMCQQYVVRAGTVDFTIRQEKPADKALIPLNTPVEFELDKSKMKFKANGKSYEYLVVGQTAVPPTGATSATAASKPQ